MTIPFFTKSNPVTFLSLYKECHTQYIFLQTSVEYSALKLWQSSIIYQTLRTSDKGLYDCTIENTVLVGMSLDVLEGIMNLSRINYSAIH